MSARHLQEMLGGSQLEHVEEDEDSGEDIIPVYQPRNSFLVSFFLFLYRFYIDHFIGSCNG